METVTSESSACDKQESAIPEACCLTRIGSNADWLLLPENQEIKIGRGVDVTYQLVSPSCPLMISRLHCCFKQKGDGHWTVTDKKSLNGVWVNGIRIPAERAHRLRLGDSIKLGVAAAGAQVEHEYIFVRRPLKELEPHLAQVNSLSPKALPVANTSKRKFSTDETEPSTSSKQKLYRGSMPNTSCSPPGLDTEPRQRARPPSEDTPGLDTEPRQRARPPSEDTPGLDTEPRQRARPPSEDTPLHAGKRQEAILISDDSNSPSERDNLQMFSQNLLTLRARVKGTQKQLATLEGTSQQGDASQEAQVRELQGQLGALRTKTQHMEMLEKSFSQTRAQLAQKTKQEEEVLKKQLEDALQEQRNVMEELAHSRQGFEQVLLAKNRELELTKEEKEKERAKKEQVVTQMTEVMENELQCIICSELFIQAYVLNCSHIFCLYCIGEWRKRKDECPICRQTIRSQTRCLAVDNFIDSMVQNLSADTKTRRQVIVNEREGATPPEVTVIQDDSSTTSSSSSSSGSSGSSLDSGSESDSDAADGAVENISPAGGSIHLDSSGDGTVESVGTDSSHQSLDLSSSTSNISGGDDGFYNW
ncbi:E3 ubiquitin-protein ligase rnf8 isoform X1 [Gadus chalcogrammus]|uniref:E3 ubiquitin-protein ligase rnf8 isoform X1 n=1 Tax=Gadus chalcogrammus TaxID=1042646 RepID=UPI0024C4B80F|nr:E3 ubiquitin-protein ligase rnf8 isoform X1 [Gadus chalcogrammus]